MNNIVKIVCCSMFATLFVLCESCKDESRTPKPSVITLDLKSGDGIRKSIDLISAPENWTQARFDSINLAISSLAISGEIDQDMGEDKEFLANLFTSSALCLEHKVDFTFRQPVYTGYDQMKKDLAFLQKYLPKFLKIGVVIEPRNPSLEWVARLFAEYDKRLKLSKYKFSQEVKYLDAYNQDYTNTAKSIKENDKPNEYWDKYFSHNTEIVNGVNAFPSRLSQSRSDYYAALEIIIEKKATEENFSKEELEAVEKTFYEMAEGYNQKAIDKLGKFRENYTPRPEETTE